MPHDEIPGKNGENSETNKHGDLNSPNTEVFIEHDISGHKFFYYFKEMSQITLLVTNFFFYINKTTTSSGSLLLQQLMTMGKSVTKPRSYLVHKSN